MSRVVAQVGVHQEDEVTATQTKPVHVGTSQSALGRPRQQHHPLLAEHALQLLGDLEGPVGAAVVDHHDLEVDPTPGEVAVDQGHDQRKVLRLVEGGQDDAVLGLHG